MQVKDKLLQAFEEDGTLYAKSNKKLVSKVLDADVTRMNVLRVGITALESMLQDGLVEKQWEVDDLNVDPRCGAREFVWAYKLTDAGKAELLQSSEQSLTT